jgi:hypothetical protein
MLESSEPKIIPKDYATGPYFDLPSNFHPRMALGEGRVFEEQLNGTGSREVLLDLVRRTSKKHGVSKIKILSWLADVSWHAPTIIFAAGTQAVSEDDIHVIAISANETSMQKVQKSVFNKPKGVWAFYTAFTNSSSGLLSLSSLNIPFWIRGILCGKHFFVTTNDDVYPIVKRLRMESVGMARAAPQEILSELALFDAYRKLNGRMPPTSNMSLVFLIERLSENGYDQAEIFRKCADLLRLRGVKQEYVERVMRHLGSYYGISAEEMSKYSSNIMLQLKRKIRKTPSSIQNAKLRQKIGK